MLCSLKPEAVEAREAAKVMLVLKYGSLDAAHVYWEIHRDCVSWRVDTWTFEEADAITMYHYIRNKE